MGKVLAGIECVDGDDDGEEKGVGMVKDGGGNKGVDGVVSGGGGGVVEGHKRENSKGGRGELETFLNRVGYPYVDVTESEVYRMFLRER